MAERRTADELRGVANPAWPMIVELIGRASEPVRVLPAVASRRDVALEALQVTAASFLGGLVAECGGLVLDHGWLRILAAGSDTLPGVHEATALRDEPPPYLDIAWDVLGGRFAINGGGLPAQPGEVCYFGPDTLSWTGIGGGHTAFITWALVGGLADFYATLRWAGWQDQVSEIGLDHGLSLYPPPFATEGRDLATSSRRPAALTELHRFYGDMAVQLARVPDTTQFRLEVTD